MSRRGSLLIVSLWLVTLLGALAVAMARYLSTELRVAGYRAAREQARALARGGVLIALGLLEADDTPEAWLGEPWAQPLTLAPAEGRQVTVAIVDEERRLSLARASNGELLALGIAAPVVEAFRDYVDEADASEDRPGEAVPYYPKNGPFESFEELRELPALSEAPQSAPLFAAHTSPYTSDRAALNLNTVSAEVLRAVGVSESAAGLVARFREQEGVFRAPGVQVLNDLKDQQGVDLTGTPDGNLLSGDGFGVASQTYTVTAEATLAKPAVRARVRAIVRRSGDDPPVIVDWRLGG
jgi:type II secretory pathway component PulK